MNKTPGLTPGTVSKILWHFTGGPPWNEKLKRQSKKRKKFADAYECFESILSSCELRLGSFKEVVRIVIPEMKVFDHEERNFEIKKNVREQIDSAPVCCLSDIPAAQLQYHAHRYGKFAIGFHRKAAVIHGFNPVLYSLESTGVIRSFYEGFSRLRADDAIEIVLEAECAEAGVSEQGLGEIQINEMMGQSFSAAFKDIQFFAESVINDVNSSRAALHQFTAFIKTFQKNEFSTVYCEREWRSIEPFRFSYDDLAMIVLPRRSGKRRFFEEFISEVIPRLKLPRSVPVVPWEDLVEH